MSSNANTAPEVNKDTMAGDVNVEHVDALHSPLAVGTERRKKVERTLLWKLDAKMSLLVVIYILNYIDRSNAAAAR